jgi:uroporphyrinogen-III decarboxylase
MSAKPLSAWSAETFESRLDRINRAIRLEPVDRIPVIFMGLAFSARYSGVPLSTYCSDGDATLEAGLDTADRLRAVGGVDGFNSFPGWLVRHELSLAWLSRVDLPGQELPEDSLWQVHEAEVMTEDEYDVILSEGWPAFMERCIPRIMTVDEYERGEAWYGERLPLAMERARERGYPSVALGGTSTPFEPLCGARSMRTFYTELFRKPDKIKAVMDVMLPHMIEAGLASSDPAYSPGLWVGGWGTSSAMLSPKLWNEMVFPYLYEIVRAMHDAGRVSVLHLDHDWTRDLARFRELPAKACVLNPDGMTDVRKAKELLGDHMAIMGDVPAGLLVTGTPDAVRAYVHDLVRDVGPTGLLLCPGCDAPLNAKPENMEAYVAAAHEFGRGV